MHTSPAVAAAPNMINVCQFGAGRIGSIHAANLAAHPEARLRYVVDVNTTAAEALAKQYGAKVTDQATALADKEVGMVVIASSTDTHADLILAAAQAKKAIFCEKPIHLELSRVKECVTAVQTSGVPMLVGFNRRFDPNFSALQSSVREGSIGTVELVNISSRDPAPPPLAYVKVSGGLFKDMMIHDFDMARWLLDEEPVSVFAAASCRVDPEIASVGDVDTAMVVLQTASGSLCHIDNSRRAVYGYDQRIEVFGSKGMLRAGNVLPTTVEHWSSAAVARDKPLHFFLERYAQAYRLELDHFLESLQRGTPPSVGAEDGLRSILLAEAAMESLRTGKAVRVGEA